MYSTIYSGALQGVLAYLVSVEVDAAKGLPAFYMVGSLSTEARQGYSGEIEVSRNAEGWACGGLSKCLLNMTLVCN